MWRRFQGFLTGIAGSGQLAREIADRKRAEEALLASEAAYESLIESLPLNVFRKDLDGRIISANQRFCESVGRDLRAHSRPHRPRSVSLGKRPQIPERRSPRDRHRTRTGRCGRELRPGQPEAICPRAQSAGPRCERADRWYPGDVLGRHRAGPSPTGFRSALCRVARHDVRGGRLTVIQTDQSRVRKIAGTPARRVVGAALLEFVHPEDLPSCRAGFGETATMVSTWWASRADTAAETGRIVGWPGPVRLPAIARHSSMPWCVTRPSASRQNWS